MVLTSLSHVDSHLLIYYYYSVVHSLSHTPQQVESPNIPSNRPSYNYRDTSAPVLGESTTWNAWTSSALNMMTEHKASRSSNTMAQPHTGPGSWMFTPPLTPSTPAHSSPLRISTLPSISSVDLDTFSLPPPMAQTDFGLIPLSTEKINGLTSEERAKLDEQARRYAWRDDMSPREKQERTEWLASGRGRKGLRIVIVTGESPRSSR